MYHILISGASRGFGRCVALEFARSLPSIPCIFSLGSSPTSAEQLETLKDEIIAIRGTEKPSYFNLVNEDFGDIDELELLGDKFVLGPSSISARYAKDEEVTGVIFINNAGSLGFLNKVETLELSHIQLAYNLNVTSSTYLTSHVLRKYKSHKNVKIHLVNISSLAAVQPFSNWSLYCAGKAARDMFFKVIVEEHPDGDVRVLNYAPGPLDTDMQREIRVSSTYQDKDTQSMFVKMKTDGSLVNPSESASKVPIL